MMEGGLRTFANQQHHQLFLCVKDKDREKSLTWVGIEDHALKFRSPLLYRLSYKARRGQAVGILGQLGH